MMMSSDDLFSSDQTNEEGQETPNENQPADLLAGILNEEGVQKYKTVEDAIEGLKHSQDFIAKLKEENQQFRSEIDKRLSAEAVLKELKAENKPAEPPSSEFSEEALQELVDKRLEAKTVEQRAKANEDLVQQKLKQELGEEAMKIVKAKADEMGLSLDNLKKLSQESPQAVFNMFGMASTKQDSVAPKLHSSVNTDASLQDGTQMLPCKTASGTMRSTIRCDGRTPVSISSCTRRCYVTLNRKGKIFINEE
jgi:hypothetical protein